jgi:hypothetical protein
MKSKNLYFGLWLTLLLSCTCAYGMFWQCCTHTNVIEQQAHQPVKKTVKQTHVIHSHSMKSENNDHHLDQSTGQLDRLAKKSDHILKRSKHFAAHEILHS